MRETRILEFKETITNTFLKTVSAFSNYDGGTVLFGIDDDGNIKGLPDVKQACLDIENKINDMETAAQRAAEFVQRCAAHTLALGTPVLEGVQFEPLLGELMQR